ncbi:hypothetical protein FKP32DRAFT_1576817 [Trametes sanguinea]|nr:hypothetical protein FKP32DRAFT_1576817 [Trametes sanguinea]
MDMLDLLNWRKTCRATYSLATECLSRDRLRVLKPFAEDAHALWELVREHRALIGGHVAQGFVLRDSLVHRYALELYVPLSAREAFLIDIELTLGLGWELLQSWPASDAERAEFYFTEMHYYRARGGRGIAIFTATTEAAVQPLVTSWSTSFANYLAAETFGVGYPSLTLRRRALACSREELATNLQRVYDEQRTRHGFQLSQDVLSWKAYANLAQSSTCLRDIYLCGHQARFFGDACSMVISYDLLSTSSRKLAEDHRMPYGVSAVWRQENQSGRSPTCACREKDPLLPGHLTSVACVIVDRRALEKAELPFGGSFTLTL